MPASLCGVVGFKPTTGRWPRNGVAPISHTLDTTGVFARSVEDCALVDQVVTGEQAAEPPGRGYGVKGARLAYAPRQFLDLVDPEVEARFREVVRRLREAGAEVVEVDLGDDFGALTQTATWSIFFHETLGAISEFLRRYDIPTTFEAIYEGLKPELREAWGHMALPEGEGAIPAEAYQTALSVSRPEIQRRLNTAFVAHRAAGHPVAHHALHRAFDRTAGEPSRSLGSEVSYAHPGEPHRVGEQPGPPRHQPPRGPVARRPADRAGTRRAARARTRRSWISRAGSKASWAPSRRRSDALHSPAMATRLRHDENPVRRIIK